MWTCALCNRSFRNQNQSHSCTNDGFEGVFGKNTPEIIEICSTFIQLAHENELIRISPLRNSILFAAKNNFCAIKPRKNHVDIEFLLDDEINEFPIYKTQKLHGNKYAHYVKVAALQEIDARLIEWFTISYKTNAGLAAS